MRRCVVLVNLENINFTQNAVYGTLDNSLVSHSRISIKICLSIIFVLMGSCIRCILINYRTCTRIFLFLVHTAVTGSQVS